MAKLKFLYRNHSKMTDMLIMCSREISYYQCWKHMLLHIFVECIFYRILR